MGILDFLKDKFGSGGSGGSGTVTTYQPYDAVGQNYEVDMTMPMPIPEIKAGAVIREGDIRDFNYVGINGKAELAKQLRDNLLLNAIFDELKEFNLMQLLNTKEGEKEAREDLYRKVRTIEDIRAKIEKHIKNAESVKKREEARKDNYGVV